MRIVRLLRPGLFIYECVRILILAGFAALQPLLAKAMLIDDLAVFPLMVFAAPSVLFPLMALFLWLDSVSYRAYMPLFLAGKCISIVSLLGWSIIVRRLTIIRSFPGLAVAEMLLLGGDLITMAVVILMLKDTEKNTNVKSIIKDAMEVE